MLHQLWTQDEATFNGMYWNFEGVVTSPKPLQNPHPPIVIGGNRAPALKRVAHLGDGWHPLGLSPEGLRKRLAHIHQEAASIGRKLTNFPIQVRRDFQGVDRELIEAYGAVGVTDLVLSCNTGEVKEISKTLDSFAKDFIES